MKRFFYIITGLVFVVTILGIGYYAGKEAGIREENQKLQPEMASAKADVDVAQNQYRALNTKYQKLTEDYDKLYDAAARLSNVSSYAPRQPIYCNSYSYGMNSVSTSCY